MLGIKSVECCSDEHAAAFWANINNPEHVRVISASTRIPAFLFTAPSAPAAVRSMRHVYRFQPWPVGKLANRILEKLSRYDSRVASRFDDKVTLRNGMYTIMLLLECGVRPVLAGFDINYDASTAYVHHYYPRDDEPAVALTGAAKEEAVKAHQKGYHDFDAEARVLRELVQVHAVEQLKVD
eukprot:jgi/Mesvir1/13192/Mv06152-RA.1